MIEGLEPVSFVYNEGNDRTRFGFIAEDTAAIDPHLATYNADGALTGIDDRAILSIIVKAIKDLASKLADLSTTVASFAESIELTFQRATGESLRLTRELCIDASDRTPVCVTGDQLRALLSQTGAAATPLSVPSSPSNMREPEPPESVSSTSTSETASSTTDTLPQEAANDNQANADEPTNSVADPASNTPPPADAPATSQAASF